MLLASMVAYDADPGVSSSEAFLDLLLTVARTSYEDFCKARRINFKDVAAKRLFLASDFVDAAALRRIQVVSTNHPTVTLDLRQTFLMIVNELNSESMVLEWSDTARAAQAETLGRLQLTVRLNSYKFGREHVRPGISFLELSISPLHF